MKFDMTFTDWKEGKHKNFTKLVIKGVNSTINGTYTIKKISDFGNGFWFYTNEAHLTVDDITQPLTKGQSCDGWDVTFFRQKTELRVMYKSNKNYMEKRIPITKFYFI
jgi:hypothetical protein